MPADEDSDNGASANNGFYSPLVLNIAKSEGVPIGELELIRGTGNEGRVTKKDILQYIEDKKSGKVAEAPSKKSSSPQSVAAVTSKPTKSIAEQEVTQPKENQA